MVTDKIISENARCHFRVDDVAGPQLGPIHDDLDKVLPAIAAAPVNVVGGGDVLRNRLKNFGLKLRPPHRELAGLVTSPLGIL